MYIISPYYQNLAPDHEKIPVPRENYFVPDPLPRSRTKLFPNLAKYSPMTQLKKKKKHPTTPIYFPKMRGCSLAV